VAGLVAVKPAVAELGDGALHAGREPGQLVQVAGPADRPAAMRKAMGGPSSVTCRSVSAAASYRPVHCWMVSTCRPGQTSPRKT
jgi:hypothetical protein